MDDSVLLYPREIELEDGSVVQITEGDWKSRQLLVEIDRSESEVRDAFAKEGFLNAILEEKKSGQLGSGLRKKSGDWAEIHVRLFQRGARILIDGELEVASRYVEHLNRKWIPALEECRRIVSSRFGAFRLYYGKTRKYISRITKNRSLSLQKPRTKTPVIVVVAVVAIIVIAGVAWWAYKKSRRPQ